MGRHRNRLARQYSAVALLALVVASTSASGATTDDATVIAEPVAPPAAQDVGVPVTQAEADAVAAALGADGDLPSDVASATRPDQVSADTSDLKVPVTAMGAYRVAEAALAEADPSCRLPWTLLSAIGRIESDHGRYGGAVLDSDGTSTPLIRGVALDGTGPVSRIPDTDGGALDGDDRWDRAVGPMQFIPSTWTAVGVDADGDGVRSADDLDDAALGAAVYLCSAPGSLDSTKGMKAAVHRYNRSAEYVEAVLVLEQAYREADLADVPPPPLPPLSALEVLEVTEPPADKPARPEPGDFAPVERRPVENPSTGKPTDRPGDPPTDQPGDQPTDQPGEKPDAPEKPEPKDPAPAKDPAPTKDPDPSEPPDPGEHPGEHPGKDPGKDPAPPKDPGEDPAPPKDPDEDPAPPKDPAPTPTPSPTPPPEPTCPTAAESVEPPLAPVVKEVTGTLVECAGAWFLDGAQVDGAPVDGFLLDVGDAEWLATAAVADLNGDGVLATNGEELAALVGAELTLGVADQTSPAVVYTVNGATYRPLPE